MYKLPKASLDLGEVEKGVLEFWKNGGIFKKSIKNLEGKPEFVFYDGPPFANGLPHYGHLLTSYIKDTVARFQTIAGKKTERRFGWDCHGLPAEMEVEKELGVSGRMQIMEYGIERFNAACRGSVMKYAHKWEEYIERAGRWVDFSEDYKTMDKPYMESVLWAFKQLHEKGLLYEDFRVMPYSWKCETPLSNFETRMDNSYREIASKALTVSFELKNPEKLGKYRKISMLAWTTTPWTLPSNLALAVNSKFAYVMLETSAESCVILAKNLASGYEKELGKKIVGEVSGAELVGLEYRPLFPFFAGTSGAFRVLDGEFVEETGGTGIVHIAPGFGEDDWALCKKNGIGIACPVDDSGKFTAELYPHIDFRTSHLAFVPLENGDEWLIKAATEGHSEMAFENADTSADFYIRHARKFGIAPMAVVLAETGEKIGIAGPLVHDETKGGFADGNAEVLCFLLPHARGRGLGREAFSFFTKLLFVRFGLSEVLAVAKSENLASKNTLTSCGFEYAEEIFDPRAKQKIEKFVCTRHPRYFETRHLKFSLNRDLPELPPHLHPAFDAGDNAYFVYGKVQNQLIGGVEFADGELRFGFAENTDTSAIKEALSEVLNRFCFAEATVHANELGVNTLQALKQVGFFEVKGGFKRHSEVLYFAGRQVFEVNDDISDFLKYTVHRVRVEQILHNYPHCWRTDTPLIYKAVSSWYVRVTAIKERMVELNREINWIPEHIKSGQFGKWLENARDWSITRNRFWGCPVPVWKSENPANKELYVFGSIEEIEAFFGRKVKDLHRPFIDDLVKEDPLDPQYKIRRVSDVLDCWFESGSMPFASVHYPFENKDWFEAHFPADFIVEYVAQTRGWFYTMMVLSTALFDRIPFKTCLCHGVILDAAGQKLSKRLRNYPDPLEVFETYGSDAMRWFLLSSPVVSGGDLCISKDGAEIRDVVRLVIKPIWSAYTFFAVHANADGITAAKIKSSQNVMDRYILSKLEKLSADVFKFMEEYNFEGACRQIAEFIDALNNWYIRRSKERFWRKERDEEKLSAYNTLYTVLLGLSGLSSPLLPFTSEAIFLHLQSNAIDLQN